MLKMSLCSSSGSESAYALFNSLTSFSGDVTQFYIEDGVTQSYETFGYDHIIAAAPDRKCLGHNVFIHSFFFIKIYFKRISRLKFAKFKNILRINLKLKL